MICTQNIANQSQEISSFDHLKISFDTTILTERFIRQSILVADNYWLPVFFVVTAAAPTSVCSSSTTFKCVVSFDNLILDTRLAGKSN